MNAVFQTAPIGSDEWVRICEASVAGLLFVEIQKWFFNRRERSGALAS